jgi:hypothetical protein
MLEKWLIDRLLNKSVASEYYLVFQYDTVQDLGCIGTN